MHETPVTLHPSTRPEAFAASLRRGLEQRRIDPKFHYTTPAQAQAWLALHKKYSPFVTTTGGTSVYDTAFAWTATHLTAPTIHLLSLACGGAGKELRLVRALQAAGKIVTATVSDISAPLVREGAQALTQDGHLPDITGIALDLLTAVDLAHALATPAPRLITCFGLMPNVEPQAIATRLAPLTGPDDLLLIGANLVPVENYEQSTHAVLGDYDNQSTRDWLGLLINHCGFTPDDGEIRFTVEPCATLPALLQIVARYHFLRNCTVALDNHELKFTTGENLRLFFSNRYTPALLKQVFAQAGLTALGFWLSPEKTEGVLACTAGR